MGATAIDLLGAAGEILDVTASEYHADPCETPSLSSTILKRLLTATPAHARAAHPRLNPAFVEKAEDKFDLGTAAHELLLEGEASVEVCDFPNWGTNAAKAARAVARDAGLTPLLAKDWDRVQAMANAARRQLEMVACDPAPLTAGKAEQTLVWDDGGVLCRARIDWLHDDLTAVDDLKTTGASASPRAWAKTMFGMGAEIQAAFYLRGLEKALGARPTWRFVVQENYEPYALSVVTLAPEVLALAARKVEYALNVWRRCMTSGVWPAYSLAASEIEPLPWQDAEWDARLGNG